MLYALAERTLAAPLAALALTHVVPEAPLAIPHDPWPEDEENANDLFHGLYAAAGQEVRMQGAPPWALARPSPGWAAEMSGFAWLRDFRSGGIASVRCARDLVASWIAAPAPWRPLSWRADIVGRRLMSWCCAADLLLEGADNQFRTAFLASLARQARHLARSVRSAPRGAARMAAVGGLLCAAAALGHARWRTKALRLLERELAIQVLADGGHVERNPERHVAVLHDLTIMHSAVAAAGTHVPVLAAAIERMAPMARFFRLGDHRMAQFNGGRAGDSRRLHATLAAAASRAPTPTSAPDTGFERMSARGTVVLADVGAMPPGRLRNSAHAGALSFEMSVGARRLIVNCGATGAAGGTDPAWREACRATAAHSTLTIDDTNSADIAPGRGSVLWRRRIARVDSRRAGASVLEAGHDGYGAPFGLRHHRRLTLDAGGEAVRGEDRASVSDPARAGEQERHLALRFHLHPDVRASLIGTGALLLRLGDGSGWVFDADGAEPRLEDSVYLGDGAMRRCQQIVLAATWPATETISWSLSRLAQPVRPMPGR